MSLRGSAAMPIHVDNGYRVSLKKDLEHALIHNFDQPLSPASIRNALSLWLQRRDEGIHSLNEPALLCEPFAHHYSDVDEDGWGFSEEDLQGRDLKIVRFLKTLTAELPFEIYLASLTREEYGELAYHYGQPPDSYWAEGSDDDDDTKSWHSFDSKNDPIDVRTHTRVFALDGSEVVLKNDKALYDKMLDNMICEGRCGDPFEDAEQWETDLDATWLAPPGSRRGMDPPTATHWYRSAMLILVPRDEVEAFQLGKVTQDRAAALVHDYMFACRIREMRASALKTLAFLARTLWSYMYSDAPDPRTGHSELGTLLTGAALEYRGYGLFNTVLRLLPSRLDPEKVIGQLGLAVSLPGFEFKRISHSLLEFLGLAEISAGCCALTYIRQDLEAAPHMLEWVTGTVSPAYMERCRTSSVESMDGAELVRFIRTYHNLDYFKQIFVPVLILKARSSPFILAAIDRFANIFLPTVQDLSGHAVYSALANAAITSLDLPALLASNHPHHSLCLARLLTRSPTASASHLATLTQHASLAPSSQTRTFWLPLLQEILSASDPSLRPLELAILTRYLTVVIGPAPTPGDRPDLRRRAVRCATRCSDCQQLNVFLESRVTSRATFSPRFPNREHFEKVALKGLKGCDVTKTNRASTTSGFLVTKKVKGYEALKAAWEERVKEGRRVVAWVGVGELLGEGEGECEAVVRGWGAVGL